MWWSTMRSTWARVRPAGTAAGVGAAPRAGIMGVGMSRQSLGPAALASSAQRFTRSRNGPAGADIR